MVKKGVEIESFAFLLSGFTGQSASLPPPTVSTFVP